MFENPELPPSALPRLADTAFQPLPRSYRKKRAVVAGIASALIAVLTAVPWVLLAFDVDVPPPAFWGVGVAGTIVVAGVWMQAEVGYRFMGYAVRRHDVTLKRGWLFRTRVTVPMSRIQHSEIFRGPLDRWLGLSTLRIFTAGSSGANLSIPGLPHETAQAIRSALISHGAQH